MLVELFFVCLFFHCLVRLFFHMQKTRLHLSVAYWCHSGRHATQVMVVLEVVEGVLVAGVGGRGGGLKLPPSPFLNGTIHR